MATARAAPSIGRSTRRCAASIQSGRLASPATGCRARAELVRPFGASRITVGAGRAGSAEGGAGRAAGAAPARSFRHARPSGRAVVRPADSRSGRDRDLRADLPGDDGLAAGAPSTRSLWGSAVSPSGSKDERAWQLCRQYIERRVSRRVLRAARAEPITGRQSNRADRRGARRGAHPDRPARSHGRALSRARPPRSRRHRQPPRGLRDHRTSAAVSARRGSRSWRGRTRRPRSMRAKLATARRCTTAGITVDRHVEPAAAMPTDGEAVSAV